MILAILLIALAFTLLPLVMCLINWSLLSDPTKPPVQNSGRVPGSLKRGSEPEFGFSILIPARNEEQRIGGILDSLIGEKAMIREVIVLDDHSTDRTRDVVESYADRIPGLSIISGKELPTGWCGKNFACQQLADAATGEWLLFLDADVKLDSGALSATSHHILTPSPANPGLISGIPRQVLGSFWEKLLIPQIHFVLLGYLPMLMMRRSLSPGFAAACGQFLVVRKSDYEAVGGHHSIADKIHDGIQLARQFRVHGIATDLLDATHLAECRMYNNGPEVFSGLLKNATEGMAAWKAIFPMTFLLFFGQALPFLAGLLWVVSPDLFSATESLVIGISMVLALTPRLIISRRFRLGTAYSLLQPLAVLVLLGIQWKARLDAGRGIAQTWKGRKLPIS